MPEHQKLIVSHAPFWHNGSRVTDRSRQIFLAALPAALFGVYQYGLSALGVLALSVSSAVLWELAFTRVAGRPVSVGDGTAAVIGLLLGMMLPASMPWWGVLTGTFLAIVVARQIYGGIGANPFNPVAVAVDQHEAGHVRGESDERDADQHLLQHQHQAAGRVQRHRRHRGQRGLRSQGEEEGQR